MRRRCDGRAAGVEIKYGHFAAGLRYIRCPRWR